MVTVLVVSAFSLLFAMLSIIIYTVALANRQPDEDEFVAIRVATYDDKAYWIFNEQLYRANLLEDGNVDHDSVEAIDSMTIDLNEMPLLFNIVEALKGEGA